MSKTREKIFMVDDDPSILKMGKLILKDHYEVFPLPSAEKLFEVLEKVTPNLILLDIMMPEIDGIETLKRLKADSRYEAIPVIFVSSIDDDESVFEHLKLGAYSSVSKPFSADQLLSRIANCFNDYFPDKPIKKDYSLSEDFIKEISDKKASQKEQREEDDKPKILAIDDAPEILRMVHLLLRDTYKVFTLSEPEKMEELLETLTPELFLLDYKMPVLSGTELVPIIRKNPSHKNTPIIFITSEKSTDFITEAIRLGACDFIIKPLKMEVLHEKVGKHF